MREHEPVISIENISQVFQSREGSEIVALENCSLEVREGEFLCIVGPSGCGKSTLLRMMSGLLTPTSGDIRMHGRLGTPDRDIGMVFQKPVLLPWKTNIDNVLLPIEFKGGSKRQARGKAADILRLVGLERFAENHPYELSGGMQQRVAISRALVSDPDLLLMDEPFGALDAMTRNTMNFELLRIWEETKRTIVFITHSITEAIFLADRVIVMSPHPGRVVETIEVGLPRPRVIEHRYSDRFAELESRIGNLLGVSTAL